jgi:predicted RNA-binding Zn-ribbon protein involved in translation (DUF1610 family)
LAADRPDLSPTAISRFSLGQRDSQLLRLREMLFGQQMSAVFECQQCGETLEFELSSPAASIPEAPPEDAPAFSVEVGPWQARFRLPEGSDLEVLADCASIEEGRVRLLERCLIEALGPDGPMPIVEASPELVESVEARMAELDPQANMAVDLTCPMCGTPTTAPFDVSHFFWQEIDQWARHTLHDVHTLARAYGWSEAEVLALTARRRQQYMELIYA